MPYDIYPAVDETYNFPQEIRTALLASTDVQSALTASKNLAKSEILTEQITPLANRVTAEEAFTTLQYAANPEAPAVATPTDLLVTAVASARTVSVAPGSALSGLIRYTIGSAQTVVLTPPGTGGKWYAISLNRQWAPNSVTLVADDLAVTDGTGAIPTAIPAAARTALIGLPNQPGTNGGSAGQRQVLAAVYVRASDTTLTIFDLRAWVNGSGMVTVGNFWAVGHIGFRYFREGGLLSVGQFATVGGGYHVRSVWQKFQQGSSYMFPVGDITIDENGATGPYIGSSVLGSVAEALRVLLFAMTELVFDQDVTELIDRYRGLRFQYQANQQKMVLKPTDKTKLITRNNTAQLTVTNGTWTALPLDTAIMDNLGMWNYGSDNRRIKLPFRGRYRVIIHFCYGNDSYQTGVQATLFDPTGASQNSDPPQYFWQNTKAGSPVGAVTDIYNDTPGRSMYIRVFQLTGGNVGVYYGNYPLNTEVTVEWLGDNNVGG